MDRPVIVTNIFQLHPGQGASAKAAAWCSRWWWALALPILAGLIAGFYDWRWWIAGMAIACVLWPGLLAWAYFNYALSPECAEHLLPHAVQFDGKGLTLSFTKHEHRNAYQKFYPWAAISEKVLDGKWLTFKMAGRQEEIIVPVSAFKSNFDLQKTLNYNA